LVQKENYELNATALLLTRRFRWHFLARLGLLLLGAVGLPLAIALNFGKNEIFFSVGMTRLCLIAFLLVSASEFLGRYLFFVTVVPKKMAGGFLKS